MVALLTKTRESLPPTLSALKKHIYRVNYMAMVWRRNIIHFQKMPSPVNYGWKYEGCAYHPIMTLKLPAPKSIINLVKCNCRKGCEVNCSCHKNQIPCTEICGCMEYECRNSFNTTLVETSLQVESE